ncbi:MAG: NIPSNAP family protein [Chloroflexi bacterium]|nr:NIPSNAP family protein [Chloroflexota bacterium]
MFHELRTYVAAPGRLNALHREFEEVVLPIWKRYGIKAVAFWTEEFGTSNQLVYLLEWASLAEREQKWTASHADPEWKAAAARWEQGPANTLRIENRMLRPTNYSPLK